MARRGDPRQPQRLRFARDCDECLPVRLHERVQARPVRFRLLERGPGEQHALVRRRVGPGDGCQRDIRGDGAAGLSVWLRCERYLPADYWNCGVAQNGCSVSNAAVLLSLESDGEFLPAPSPPSRVIHVLGDSITAATNVRGGFNQCGDRTSYADYADSWAGLLCAFFDASCSTVAVGGKGLVRNCCDNGTTVPEYYTQLKKNDPVGSFGFDDAPPSAIIIYLGTNDYNKGVLPGLDQAFTDAYVALIANISERYYGTPAAPLNATFFAVLGPMSPFYPQNATLAAVAEASTRGYQVVFVNATTACGANLTGCTDGCASHPGMAGHRNIATIVAAAVESAMGWPSPGVL